MQQQPSEPCLPRFDCFDCFTDNLLTECPPWTNSMQNAVHTKARCCTGRRANLIVLIHAWPRSSGTELVVLVRASSTRCPWCLGPQGALVLLLAFVATKVNIHRRHIIRGPGCPAGVPHPLRPSRPACRRRRLTQASERAGVRSGSRLSAAMLGLLGLNGGSGANPQRKHPPHSE